MRITRRLFIGGAFAVVAARPMRARATDAIVVENWKDATPGATGVPPGWRPYETPMGRPAYDFTVVADGARRALHLKSASEHSTIAREMAIGLAETPVLKWEWKVVKFAAGADLRGKSTSDATGHVFVIWPRFPAAVRSQLIGYVWDPVLPEGTIVKSRKTSAVTFIIARSGAERAGQWVVSERNVATDYRVVYGEAPPAPKAIALSIDTNDTRSSAETLFGQIAFVAR